MGEGKVGSTPEMYPCVNDIHLISWLYMFSLPHTRIPVQCPKRRNHHLLPATQSPTLFPLPLVDTGPSARQQLPRLGRGTTARTRDVAVNGVKERNDGHDVRQQEMHGRVPVVKDGGEECRQDDKGRIDERGQRAVRELKDAIASARQFA